MQRRRWHLLSGLLALALVVSAAGPGWAAQGDDDAATGPGMGTKIKNWVTAGETGGSLQ